MEWDDEENEFFKNELDEMHLAKIDMSDEIFVINNGGYIGRSTQLAIAYAKATNKVIRSLEPIGKNEIPELYPIKGLVKKLTYNCIQDCRYNTELSVGDIIDDFYEDSAELGGIMFDEAHSEEE